MRTLIAVWMPGLAFLLCLASLGSAVVAEDIEDLKEQTEENTPDVKEKIKALIAQQNLLADQFNAAIMKVKKDAELSKLNAAITTAKAALAHAEANNNSLAEAREQEKAVRESVKKAIEQKLNEHPEGGSLVARKRSLVQKRDEYLWQEAYAQFQIDHVLSPISRALADDAELASAKAKLKAAKTADKGKAQAEYNALKTAKLSELEEGQRLLAVLEDSQSAANKVQQTIVTLEQRLAPIQRAIERIENLRITEARAQVSSALNNDQVKKLRQAVNDCITDYNELVTKLIDQSEEVADLKAQHEAVKAKVKALRQ